MATPIKYRISSVAPKPTADSVKGAPLTSLEIDGNFRSLKDAIDTVNTKITPVTVANLPVAATIGSGGKSFVSDATSTTFASIVVGGGSNAVPVYCDGTNWRIG